MSRYKVFLLQVLLFFPLCLLAEKRSLEQARDIAYAFMESGVVTKGSSLSLRMVYDGADVLTKSSSLPPYYVFDNEIGPGFVIVSGDDSALPVLGYSRSGNFSAEGMPSNLRWWLDAMKSQVESLKGSETRPADGTAAAAGKPVVLYETAKWDQWDPYNMECPEMIYNGKSYRAVTGCGPTAVAIVMRYRQFPEKGVGTIPGYTTYTHKLGVPSRTLGHEYDWQDMPLQCPEPTSWTYDQKSEVANLIADLGAAMEADYGISQGNDGGTSVLNSRVVPALTGYFGFDRIAYLAERGFYSDQEWYAMLKEEIRSRGPVIYTGQASNGGHMFVLDGYDTDDYFHVNWGWSGQSDGYYSLSAMNPGQQGAGSFEGGYNSGQSAVMNLIPDQGGEAPLMLGYYCFENQYDTYRGLYVKEYDSLTGLPSLINFGGIWNIGPGTYSDGKIRIVVADRDGNVVKTMCQYTGITLSPTYYTYFWDIELNDYGNLDFGYSLMAQYYDYNENVWKKIRADKTNEGVDEIPLTDPYSIEESTSFRYDNQARLIRIQTKPDVTVSCLVDGNEVCAAGDEDDTFVINTGTLAPGTYTLTLSKGEEFKELRFVIGTKED